MMHNRQIPIPITLSQKTLYPYPTPRLVALLNKVLPIPNDCQVVPVLEKLPIHTNPSIVFVALLDKVLSCPAPSN
jgi:hypothetical protein